ncbi:MAG TPA: serine/threonine-protein kinase [Opitutaceae bacterium]|nr:serine/threonine-protein kinase [Opitutaceae bacterium]HND59868.1 serine/threonine-protein kinase [Opitutaceae bacterium]
MNPEQQIFSDALEQPPGVARTAFLDAACAGQPELRARIETLLRAADSAGEFLSGAEAPVRDVPGDRISRYRLGERIGEGGFGVVYQAEQEEPVRRTVALKIIKLGMDTRAVVARFEAERQALAMMDHPHIARVFDGGATTAGRPYFVMELVRGQPITTFCHEQRLTLADRLDLFVQVCHAVQHAHQKGVIHRDLKPSNILVAETGGRPVAKVIDFGIAKATHEPLTEKTLVSRHLEFIGTPAYMSPEQVGLGEIDVDTRSDIYSLGALLYELLTDLPVLDAKALLTSGYAAVLQAIHHAEPLAPSQRVAAQSAAERAAMAARRRTTPARMMADLRGDLDRIVRKCLEKDRTHRYETTEDLARDLERYRRNEPVLARPATLGYRAAMFVRRHRRSVIAGTVAGLVLAGLGAYHARRLAIERDRAQLEARKAVKASELLMELLTTSDPFRTPTGTEQTPSGMLDASAARVRQEFTQEPGTRAAILNAIGRVYLRLGLHDKARPLLTEALAASRTAGPPDLRLAQTLCDLGVLERELGDTAGAVTCLKEALALRRQLLGDRNNDVAIVLVELGRTESLQERLDLAEPRFREALAIRREVLGDAHRETATSLGDLAVLLWQQGKLAAAERCFRESYAQHVKTVGPDHPNAAQSMASLASLAVDEGRLTEAETLLRNAVAIFRRTVGESHWRTARATGQLADVWRRLGRTEEAAQALDNSRQVARASLGDFHPLVADLAVDRARVCLDRHDPAAAEPLLREALRVQQHFYPPNGWRVATTKSLLGAALLGQGRPAEAAPLLADATRILPELPGPQGRETQATRERCALLVRMQTGS